MSSSPKETVYGPFDNSAWINIPCTIASVRRMVIEEVPTFANNLQTAFAPQGLQYQRWDPMLQDAVTGARGAFEATVHQALPAEEVEVGDGMTVIGWNAQIMTNASPNSTGSTAARAADIPIRIRSATAVTTQVRAREWNRGFAINS